LYLVLVVQVQRQGGGQEGEGRKKERGGGKGRLGRESVKEGRVRKRLMGQIWSQTGVGEKVRGPGSGVAEWRERKEKEKELGLGEKRETRRGGRGGREKREEERGKRKKESEHSKVQRPRRGPGQSGRQRYSTYRLKDYLAPRQTAQNIQAREQGFHLCPV